MGLEVPGWVGRMFQVVTGDAWPAADEDEVRDLAGLWFEIAGEFQRFAPEVAAAADCLVSSGVVVGNAQAALRNTVGIVTGEGGLTVEKLAAGFEEMGRFLHGVALQVQYMKIIVIEELIILAAEVAYLVAMIPWTFGASAAGVGALQVLGREFARQVLRQMAFSIATSVVLQVGLDVVAQVAQMAEGWRGSGEWDGELTRSAAVTGVVGGVLGPVFVGLGYFPARWLGRVVGRDVGGVGANVVVGAGHEYVTDGVSGWVQDGRWRPDRFSATAGGLDEGITSVAGVGRRKRSLHGAGGVGVPGPVTLPGDGSPAAVSGVHGGPGAGVPGTGVPGAGKVAGEGKAAGTGRVGGEGWSSRGGVVDGVTVDVVTNVNAVIRGREPDVTVVWRPDVRTVGEGVAEPGDPAVPVPAGNLPEREWTGQEQEWTTAEQVWAAAGQAWTGQEQEWATDQELTVAEQVWAAAGQAWTGQEQELAAAEQVWAAAGQAWTIQEQELADAEQEWTDAEQEWTAAEQEWVARVWAPAERGLAGQEQEQERERDPAWQARTGQEQELAVAEQEWTDAEQEWVAMVWAAEQAGTSEGSGDGVEVVDAVEVRRGEVAVVEPGGVGGGGGKGGRWWSMMREAIGESEWEVAVLEVADAGAALGVPGVGAGEEAGAEAEAVVAGVGEGEAVGGVGVGGDAPLSPGGVVQGQFTGDGVSTAPAVPGAETEVVVSLAEGGLVSRQEGAAARRILSNLRLGDVGRNSAGSNVARWVGAGRPSWQGWRGGELEGVLPSWVALSALPTRSGKADPGPVAVARQTLGRTVVGALWRSVEVAQGAGQGAGQGDIAGMARRVAAAVAEQVPSAADDPGRFVVEGVPLTVGLASAFVDQTLVAVTARAPALAAVVEQERQETLWELSSLRSSLSKRRTVREAWTRLMVVFVDRVNRSAGGEVWAVLQDWLLVGSADDGVSGAAAGAGGEVVLVAGPGDVGLPFGPLDPVRVDLVDGDGDGDGEEVGGVGVGGDDPLSRGGLVSRQESVEVRRILKSYLLGRAVLNSAGMNVSEGLGSVARRGRAGGAES